MNTILLLLFFILLFSSTPLQLTELTEFDFLLEERFLSSWITLDLSQANTNPQIQRLLYTGVQNATQKAIYEGYLASGTYSVDKVQQIEKNQDVTNTQDYRFTVDISSRQGVTQTMIFEVTYDPAKGTSEVTSYWFTGLEIETETEQFFLSEEGVPWGYFYPLDLDQALADPQIQKLLNMGFRMAMEFAIQVDLLRDNFYYISQINSISLNAFEQYKFDVDILSSNGNPSLNNFYFIVGGELSSEIYVEGIGVN